MNTSAIPARFSAPSRVLHWLSALVIVALLGVGLYMTGLDREDPSRAQIYGLHKSVGVLSLFLLLARLAWLRVRPGPDLPAVFNDKEKQVTRGIRSLLYLLLVLIPVSGWVMSNTAGYPVSFFGLFQMPTLLDKSEGLHELAEGVHALTAYAAAALVLLHAAGALKHRLRDRGGEADVLARML